MDFKDKIEAIKELKPGEVKKSPRTLRNGMTPSNQKRDVI